MFKRRFGLFVVVFTLVVCMLTQSSYSVMSEGIDSRRMENYSNFDFTGVNQYKNTVVKIFVDTNNNGYFIVGSGFFINDTEIITAAHLLEVKNGVYGGEISIRFSYQKDDGVNIYSDKYHCEIVCINPKKDISKIKIDVLDDDMSNWIKSINEPLTPTNVPLVYGEKIFYCGYSQGSGFVSCDGFYLKSQTFYPDNFYNDQMILNGFSTTGILATKGMSGGPAINSDGKLVGMISAGDFEGNNTYFVGSYDIFNLFK